VVSIFFLIEINVIMHFNMMGLFMGSSITLFLLFTVVSIFSSFIPTFPYLTLAAADTSSHHSDIPLESISVQRHDNGQIICNRCTINTGGTPGPIGTDDIEDGAVTNPKLANGAVTAEKINGLQKLFFGSCSGSLPPIEPEGTTWELLVCDVPAGAGVGDRVVASATVRGLPSPVLVLSEIFHTQPESRPLGDYLIFAFVNGAEFSTPAQEVAVSYIIFKEA
jgi:hypothetical protein